MMYKVIEIKGQSGVGGYKSKTIGRFVVLVQNPHNLTFSTVMQCIYYLYLFVNRVSYFSLSCVLKALNNDHPRV